MGPVQILGALLCMDADICQSNNTKQSSKKSAPHSTHSGKIKLILLINSIHNKCKLHSKGMKFLRRSRWKTRNANWKLNYHPQIDEIKTGSEQN
jgi:hypothetical protein